MLCEVQLCKVIVLTHERVSPDLSIATLYLEEYLAWAIIYGSTLEFQLGSGYFAMVFYP